MLSSKQRQSKHTGAARHSEHTQCILHVCT